MATKYTQKDLQEVAKQYGISVEQLSGDAPKYTSEVYTKIQNALKSPTASGYKPPDLSKIEGLFKETTTESQKQEVYDFLKNYQPGTAMSGDVSNKLNPYLGQNLKGKPTYDILSRPSYQNYDVGSLASMGTKYETINIDGKIYHKGTSAPEFGKNPETTLYDENWNPLGQVAEGRTGSGSDYITGYARALGYNEDFDTSRRIGLAQQFLPGYAKTQAEIAAQDTTPASGKSYVNASGQTVTPKTAAEERNMLALGFKQPGTTGTTGIAKKEVGGFPQSSNEYDQWIAMGRTFENGKWYEPGSSGGAPGGDVGGGGGGDIPGGGTPDIPSLSFNLDDVISGQFNTDDLMDIFSSPIGQGDIEKLLDENLKLRQQFLDSLNPTDAEIQLKSDLSDLRNEIQVAQLDYRKGVANIQQGLVSTRVMTGQEESLYTQTQLGMQTLAIQESNLLSRLGLEQESREASARVIGAALEFNNSDIDRLNTMQNQIFNQKMAMFNVMSQFSTRAQNTLNLVLDGLVGIDVGDLDNATITKLQSMTKSAGIPWEVVQQSLKVKKDEYEYGKYMDDLDRQVMEAKLEGAGGSPDFTSGQKLELEQAGINWNDPVGRQKALDYLYKQGPENVEEMMTQYKGLIQQYKDNKFSKEDAESLVRSENGIKEDEEIPGPYQDVIDEIYTGAKTEKKVSAWQRFVNWLNSPVEKRK